jgi:uncharacterized protein (TIGR02996 family)
MIAAIVEKLLAAPAVKSWYTACYEARRDRTVNPEGDFDKQGRWYYDASENCGDSFRGIRGPTRNWPYSYMLRARTRQHARCLAAAWLTGDAELPADFTASAPVRAVVFARLVLPPAGRGPDGLALLAACLDAAPGDETPWLVLADYLDDADKACRKAAAYIRSLATAPAVTA